jgi:anti-sigma factor RsiW
MSCTNQCGEGLEMLLAFSSRRLDVRRKAAVEGHLRECAECTAFVAAQRSVSDALDLFAAPSVSADFDRRLYQRIEQEAPWWDFLVRPFRAAAFAPRWLPVASAAALVIAVGLWVGRPGEAPAPPQTAHVEALPPEQAADALQEMQVMQEFSNLIHADAEPRM